MNIGNYQNYVHEGLINRGERGRPTAPDAIILEMVGELGEALNAYKHARKWIDVATATEEAHLGEELGDLLWYVFAVCDTLGFDVEEVVRNNMYKLDERYGNI